VKESEISGAAESWNAVVKQSRIQNRRVVLFMGFSEGRGLECRWEKLSQEGI
jgi:hypothetical protein